MSAESQRLMGTDEKKHGTAFNKVELAASEINPYARG
jgi:hypothetical protein